MAELRYRPTPRRQSQKKRDLSLQMILQRFAKHNPKPHCELYYKTPYQLLVSVVLSAQTTDKMVNRCMKPLYDEGFSTETVLQWGELGLLKHIRSIGLANSKARYIYKLTNILVDTFQGQVPHDRSALETLPGVGRKTASVVLGELFEQPTLAVDTHVFRVSRRLGWHKEKTPTAAEKALLPILPESYLPRAHHWLVLHGRYICKAQKPKCRECFLNDLCPSVDPKPILKKS
ncbi:MAG: endonuclease III [Deltaproteobacteria bacterium]|nr:endonuclease III [Deltaproteobacteria bacterium]